MEKRRTSVPKLLERDAAVEYSTACAEIYEVRADGKRHGLNVTRTRRLGGTSWTSSWASRLIRNRRRSAPPRRVRVAAMPRNEWLSPEQLFASRPKNIAAAGALFADPTGRVLVVKPTYRQHWLFVGGQLDEGETPEQACRREVSEEIGLEVTPGRLLLVEWTAPQPSRPLPLIMFLFDGGVIEPDQVRLNDGELADFRFLTPEQAIPLLSSNGRRRLPVALEALKTGTTLYRSSAE